jgi:hypothetical protein
MPFDFRTPAIVFAAGAALFCCSCEMHHVGEDPEVQREGVELARGSADDADVIKERSGVPTPSARPTPVEFFPKSGPR